MSESSKKGICIVDKTLLLSGIGFKKLREEINPTLFGGKGHEKENLDTFVFLYKKWGHNLCPALVFSELVHKIDMEAPKLESYLGALHEAIQRGQEFDESLFHSGEVLNEDPLK